VSIYSGEDLLGTAVADAAGIWSFTPATDLANGLHNLTATATNLAGNVSEPTGIFPITIDTVAPEADNGAKLYDDVGQITGEISSGDTTDDNLPTFEGKSEPNATVEIYDNGQKVGETRTDAEGNWSFTPSTPLVDGEHSFSTKVIDQAGNVGEESTSIDFIVDTRAVEVYITQVKDDFGSKQGNLSKGDVTDDATPVLSGKATAGGVVKIYDNGVEIGETTANASGNWSFTPSTELGEGLHNLTATVTTEAKGESEHTSIFDLTVDTTAPNQPSIDDARDDVGVVQGSIGNGNVTDDTTPTLSGQGEPGSTVHVYDNGDLLGSVEIGESGEWTFTPTTPLPNGEHSFTVTNEDKAGNVSDSSDPYVVIIDTLAPTQVVSITSMGKDSGVSSSDWVTNDGGSQRLMQGTLSAVLAAHEKLQISTDGGLTWTDVSVDGLNWSAQDNKEHTSNWTIKTRIIDSNGQVGGETQQAVILDTKAPDAPTSISVSDGKATVAFDAKQVVAGDILNIVSGGQSMDYVLTAADIAAGKATIAPTFAIDADAMVAMVDKAGNTSLYRSGSRVEVDFQDESVRTLHSQTVDFGGFTAKIGAAYPGYGHQQGILQGNAANLWDLKGIAAGDKVLTLFSANNAKHLFTLKDGATATQLTVDIGNSHAVSTINFYDDKGALVLTQTYIAPVEKMQSFTWEMPAGKSFSSFELVQTEADYIVYNNFVIGTSNLTSLVEQDVAANASGVFHGGSEDNLFNVADVSALDKVQIEGNEGIDTLKLLGGGQTLDLSALVGKIGSVEILDITGSGDNTLKLSLADVLENGAKNLFANDGNVQLMVKGNAGDHVELSDLLGADGADLGDWSAHGQMQSGGVTYNVYQHSGMAAELLVQSGIDVNLINHS
jgi:hypothetical protein